MSKWGGEQKVLTIYSSDSFFPQQFSLLSRYKGTNSILCGNKSCEAAATQIHQYDGFIVGFQFFFRNYIEIIRHLYIMSLMEYVCPKERILNYSTVSLFFTFCGIPWDFHGASWRCWPPPSWDSESNRSKHRWSAITAGYTGRWVPWESFIVLYSTVGCD